MGENQKEDRPRAGYEDDYDEEVESQMEFNRRACNRLSVKWSDAEERGKAVACPVCGKPVGVKKYRVKRTIVTRFGEVPVYRNYHVCPCGHGFYPKDEELGFDDENLSRDVSAWAMDLAVSDTFEASRERMNLHHGLTFSATKLLHLFERKSRKLADRKMPCPPVPLPVDVKNPYPAMIQMDGSMLRHRDGWHETKLMSVEALGSADRVYLADARSKNRFEDQLRFSPGYEKLKDREVLWIADDAPWIWNMKRRLCPHAHELLDYYHVMEHAEEAGKKAYGEKSDATDRFTDCLTYRLLWGETREVFDLVKEHIPYKPRKQKDKPKAKAFGNLLKYLQKNRNRLNYREFLSKNWPIGSGGIESAHKFVLQKRMKQSGMMMWSPENAQRMATMRALKTSVGHQRFYDTLEKENRMAA